MDDNKLGYHQLISDLDEALKISRKVRFITRPSGIKFNEEGAIFMPDMKQFDEYNIGDTVSIIDSQLWIGESPFNWGLAWILGFKNLAGKFPYERSHFEECQVAGFFQMEGRLKKSIKCSSIFCALLANRLGATGHLRILRAGDWANTPQYSPGPVLLFWVNGLKKIYQNFE